jgi:NADP-dependent 3-hydroxy acid dehydrogenase YdfG
MTNSPAKTPNEDRKNSFTDLRGKLVMITGATSGIGYATAEILASRGAQLILTGRRAERLSKLAEELTRAFGVEAEPLSFDISDRDAVEEAMSALGHKIERLDILVNNAGLALGTTSMPEADIDDWEAMIDTNVKGLLVVTRLALPHLVRRRGAIVNIGSVAGRWVYPGGGVYCATKFAVRALSEGLRLDLMGTGVRVTNIEPGMVETEFSQVRFQDMAKAQAVYRDMTPLEARDIAETVVWCLERPQHVNVQELVIYPTDQAGVGNQYVARRSSV